MRLQEIVHLNFDVVVVDGMRIGGSGGDFEIGATVDANLSALRDPVSGEPYIPGSSLKGKLRSLAEKVNGSFVDQNGRRAESQEGNPCKCGRNDCKVCPIFGAHMNPSAESAPTRIRVRDAHLTPKSSEAYQHSGQLMEHKTENLVNRKTGTARDPRTGERVTPGTRFAAHIILQIYDDDKNRKNLYLETIKNALGLLEQADSLGASGSRGFGTVKLTQSRKAVYRCPRCSGTLWGRAGQLPNCGKCGTAYICYVGGIPLDAEAPSISSVPQESAIKSVPLLGGVPAQVSTVPPELTIKSVRPLREITARDFAIREYVPPSLRPNNGSYPRS